MKITNFGGATALLEHKGKKILFDPWLDDGIFHGSWYHYPPLNIGVEALGRLDYVYISHIHEDHCSAETIRHINPDAEIILIDREPNFVARFLKTNNFHFKEIHLVKPRTKLELEPGLVVDMIEPDPANEMARVIDSALMICWDDFILYNANDCQPYSAGIQYILENYAQVDLALLPYSGGSGYPSCYLNLSDEEKATEKTRILNARLASFIQNVRTLNPKYVLPFADQYVIGGSRSHLNRYISHPPTPGVVRIPLQESGTDAKLILLNSGQHYNFDEDRKIPDLPYDDKSDNDRESYIDQSLKEAKYDHEKLTFSPGVSIERLLQTARARLWQIQEKQKNFPRFSFYFDATDREERFIVDLQSAQIQKISRDQELVQPYLRIAVPDSLLIMLIIGHISWNIADAALFLDYDRVPNQYDTEIYVLLNYLRI
jgi:UDP-MurNAc hydroxylase